MAKDLPNATRKFTSQELGEVFPANPIREVDFEIRFTPRLRVQAEMWRFQERVVTEYPDVALESALLPNGATLSVTVFQNLGSARLIKVSPHNMALAFSAYANFEDFKDEVLKRSSEFCQIFEVSSNIGSLQIFGCFLLGLGCTFICSPRCFPCFL
jgi:uncharacterized protein (TIGR04255 family)